MEQDVQGEGGLTHTGTGGQQDQLRGVQAREGPVQVDKARGHTGDIGPGQGEFLEVVEDIHQDLGQGFQALGVSALTDAVDPLFGQVQHSLGGLAPLLDQLGQVPGGVGDPAEKGLVLDDADILLHIGGSGGDLHELEDVAAGGVLVVDPGELHLVQHRHRVNGGGEVEHGVDGLIDLPVGPQVEVVPGEGLHHVGDTAGVNEHGTQHGLLGLHTVGDLS